MKPYLFGLFGSGGLAREVAPIIRSQINGSGGELKFVVPSLNDVTGPDYIFEEEFLAAPGDKRFCVAIADPSLRKRLFGIAVQSGAQPDSVIAPSATVYDTATVGDGAIVMPNATVSADTVIGCGVIVNFNAYVAHDCRLAAFVTIGPAAVVAGNVEIGENAIVGAGAKIRNGESSRKVRIHSGAVLGMGAVVLGDVDAQQKVVGVPATVVVANTDAP